MLSSQNKKRFITILLIVFLFTSTFAAFTPKKVQAISPGVIIVNTGKWVWEQIKEVFDVSYKEIMSTALKRSYQMFLENLAYDAATHLAEGAKGKKATWTKKNWNTYLSDAGNAAVSEFLDSALTSFDYEGMGLDICQPPSGINLKLKTGLEIAKSGDKPSPRCSLDSIKKKWGDLGKQLDNDGYLALIKLNGKSLDQLGFGPGYTSEEIRTKLLQSTISVKESDLGFVQYSLSKSASIKSAKEDLARITRTNPDNAMPVTSIISNDVEVPGAVSEKKLEDMQDTAKKSTEKESDSITADVANIFLNTLVNKTISNLILNLFTPDPPQNDEEGDDRTPYAIPPKGPNIIEKTFTSIKRISYNINPTDVDIISKMEMDLGNNIVGEMNNGTIDSDLAEALRKAQAGEALLLREAIEEGLIDPNKWFGYIDVASKDPKQPSVAEGFSYDNIKKLVKNRVVSVGWLFAAEKIKEVKGDIFGCSAQGCTLGNVIKHYDKSGTYKIDKDEDGVSEIYKNEYCGWRSIGADPYFIEIDDANNCNEDYLSANGINLTGVQVKWIGRTSPLFSVLGICYEYRDFSDPLDGVIDNIYQLDVHTEAECLALNPTEVRYTEWVPGGCMIIEEDESPLCHLVDPDTVLKAPAQQCNAEGYYSTLETTDSYNRQKDCAEVKHCIQEDDDGKCVGGYDYCVKEENIWRFNGDSCSKQYNSCTTLVDDEGEQESYLVDTLKNCPQEEVGCREYILEEHEIDNGHFRDNNTKNIYFNSSIEECSDSAIGCSEFIEIIPGINLIPNGNFEINGGPEDEEPDGWLWIADSNFNLEKDSYLGTYSIKHNSSDADYLYMKVTEERVFYTPDKGLYTLSYYAKGSDSVITPKIVFYFEDGSNSNEIENVNANFSGNNNWKRMSGYFSVPDVNKKVKYIDIKFEIIGDTYIDGVQFELNKLVDSDINEGEGDPSTYKEYGSQSKNYFKKAPDYLECEDYDLNLYNCEEEYNPCCDFVKYCPAEDLSCSAYYPVNRDPFVPAVIEDEDKCVSECNNYQTFVALPSYFENLESIEENGNLAISTDNNFIPNTAKDCSEPSCELFTNIDKLENGAESKEYYNFVRQCVKPEEANIELYYTWEGSDTSAFQLKTWKLLVSDENDPLNINGGYAPCTNISIGGTVCNDTNIMIEECNPATDLNCRTFYDEDAIPHNRLLSKTIPITEECINLRRELSNQVYKIAPSMSKPCEAENVGCTTYKGNNSNNVRNIFIEDFEGGSTLGWMANIKNQSNNINLRHASEAIHYNGSSMKVWVADNSNEIQISYNLTAAGKKIVSGKQYSLGFWAKSFGDNISGNDYTSKTQVINTDNVLLTFDNNLSVINNEWSLYEYSAVDFYSDSNGDIILNFKVNINNTIYQYDGIYIDNIILKGFASSFDKIKDSWETPKVCLDNDYLGCQKYQDTNNDIFYLYQFSDLCPEENIGCTAMIDTQNSTMPWQQTFNAYCGVGNLSTECSLGKYYYKNYYDVSLDTDIVESTVIIPEDKLIYIVKDDNYSCLSSNKGCQEMSIVDNNGEKQNVYNVNNPDYYISNDIYGGQKNILCLDEYMNCVSFKNLDGSKLHKIHPRNLTCSYQKEDVERSISAGFFTKDGEDCQGLLYNEDYDSFTSNIVEEWKPYTPYNNKYAALCPGENNGCSGFIDPLDNLDLSDYVYSRLGVVLNYNHPSQWKQASWLKIDGEAIGEISDFDPTGNGISYHLSGSENDHDGLNIVLSDIDGEARNLLIYRGPDYNKDSFFFNVESDTTYRLSAKVKFPSVENSADSIMTFLSCRPSTIEKNNATKVSFDKYFVSEDWYENNDNEIPYAFPAIKSNYSATSDNDEWQYIYGLYKILPGAHYCNIAFYINGDSGDRVTLADVNLEKVEGDYYYLDNDSLDYDSCNSANLKEGCVLFHDITTEGLKWNHEISYDEERLVPGSDRNPSDVNTLLKVTRDNQCAEWLTCGAHLKSLDPQTNQVKDACVSLIACDELSTDKVGVCAHPFLNGKTSQPLTLDYYHQMRGKSAWSDLDYTGYSIPGLYPLDSLTSIEIVNNSVTSTVLGHLVVQQDSNNQPFVYKFGSGVENFLLSSYSENNLFGEGSMIKKSCRLYPEKDSPFPWIQGSEIVSNSIVNSTMDGKFYIDIKTKSSNFENANICQTGSDRDSLSGIEDINIDGDCECHYTKVNYGNETLYFPYDYKAIPDSIEIEHGGINSTLQKSSEPKYLGWKGFCLDKEKSLFINNTESSGENMQDYRCLSWYPIDLLSGEIDAYASSNEADISFGKVDINSKLCLIGEDWTTTEDRIYCGYFDADKCTVIVRVPAGTKINVDKLDEYEFLLDGDFSLSSNYSYEINDSQVGKSIIWNPDPEDGWEVLPTAIDDWETVSSRGLFIYNDFIENLNAYDGSGTCDLMNDEGSCSLIHDNDNNGYGILEELFSAGNEPIEYFYYDEGVASNGEWDFDIDSSGNEKKQKGSKILSPVNSIPANTYGSDGPVSDIINSPEDVIAYCLNTFGTIYYDGYKYCGEECLQCSYYVDYEHHNPCANGLASNEAKAQSRALDHEGDSDNNYCYDQNSHLVDWICKDSSWCSGNNRDSCTIYCSPHLYNYYISGGSTTSSCSETNCNAPGKGIDCLHNDTDDYNFYSDILSSSLDEDGIFSEDNCLNAGYTEIDCSFIECIEGEANTDGYCSGYDVCSTTAHSIEEGIVEEIYLSDELYSNAYGTSTIDGVSLFEGCLMSMVPDGCDDSVVYQQYSYGNDCVNEGTCIKTCKTYVDLEGATYNSNNFYLNYMSSLNINGSSSSSNHSYYENVCNIGINGEDICVRVKSGSSIPNQYNSENYYNDTHILRFGEIWQADIDDEGNYTWEFKPVASPFSANLMNAPSSEDLRSMIYVYNRPGNEERFNDFYADADNLPRGEDLNVVKSRLENVIVKVENENFHEYDGVNSWPVPVWTGIYWNETSFLEPIIKQTVHNESNGFSEGEPGISINDTHDQHIIKSGGDLYASLKFYAYAEVGTAPLQEIVIDWTGVNVDKLVLKGPFKNHKGDCERTCGRTYMEASHGSAVCINDFDCNNFGEDYKCFAKTWGDHKDACIEDDKNAGKDGFFSYSFVYTCDALNDYWRDDCTSYNSDIQGGCCVYTPEVTVTDNWGNTKKANLGNCGETCSVIIIPK